MAVKKQIEDKYIDPVFAKVGKRVYTYEYIEKLRKENLQLKKDGKPIYNLIPQKGFQENVGIIKLDGVIRYSLKCRNCKKVSEVEIKDIQ